MRSAFDAVIVGAGPAGSSAAIRLARAGWSVALVEKHTFPRRKVCGECIAASNLELIDDLGIGPAFAAAAGPQLRRVALWRGEDEAIAELPDAEGSRRWGRALGRETLDTLLLERARDVGAAIFQPCAVLALDGAAGDWHCRVRPIGAGAEATLTTPLVIAAHGSWETLPAERTTRRRGRSAGDLLAFKANFRDVALAEGLLPVLAFDGGYGGMVIADGGLATLACCVRRDRLDALRGQAPGERAGDVVEAMLRRVCGGVREALRGARREGPWLAAGPLDPGVRLGDDDGLLRIGNAAGEAHPIIGEGISMALQGAALACVHLLDAPDRAAAVRTQQRLATAYAAAWRTRFASRLRLAAAFSHVAMRPGSAAALMLLVQHWPGLLTRGARWGGKTRPLVVAPFNPR